MPHLSSHAADGLSHVRHAVALEVRAGEASGEHYASGPTLGTGDCGVIDAVSFVDAGSVRRAVRTSGGVWIHH